MSGVRQPGVRWVVTGTGTNDGVTITKTAVTGKRHVITDIDVSTDSAASVTIKNGDDTVWQIDLDESGRIHRSFQTPIYGSEGKAVSLTVSVSSAICAANMCGITVRN